MILQPKSFAHIAFGTTDKVYAASMDISAVAQLQIEQTAGGAFFNFDYGYDATLIPTPFSVRVIISQASLALLNSTYESLASPQNGIIGEYGTFTAEDLEGDTWTCSAGCEAVTKVIDDNDNITDPATPILPDIEISFVPYTGWVKS
jgi:hypothetical protein